jgi:regulator of protease activity HflC (stomatin/prohibitin superfamily)
MKRNTAESFWHDLFEGNWNHRHATFFGMIGLLLLLIIVALGSIRIISPGFVGVKVVLGTASNEPLLEGLHFVLPLITRAERIDTRIQKIEAESFEAASSDLQAVRAAITVNYHLKKDDVVKLYREIGTKYADIVILPGVAETYKATTANHTAEALITKRQTVSEQIKLLLAERLEPYGIIVDQINVVNFDFSPEFNRAIEAKVTAEQEALRAEKQLERIRFEAMQAEEKAKGEANALLEKAKAEAESLRIRLEYAKPEIILLNAVEKWDGKLPVTLLGTDMATPLINVTQSNQQH